MKRISINLWIPTLAVFLSILILSHRALAHCDGLDGPVVTAAKQALDTGNVNLILIWVQKTHEEEIRKAFQKTLAIRKLGSEAKELADMYFFETLVRIHRAGEGEPYTGLKPAGRGLRPAIAAADQAVAERKLEPLFRLVTETVHNSLHEKFKAVMEKGTFDKNNVEAGREYVEAYVIFLHYVEGLYEAAGKGHGHGRAEAEGHRH